MTGLIRRILPIKPPDPLSQLRATMRSAVAIVLMHFETRPHQLVNQRHEL
jgi:hypothetical protein